MSAMTYKCPNCNGSLVFEPELQQFHCEYCLSNFDESIFEEVHSEDEKTGTGELQTEISKEENIDEESVVIYSCPNCGAEILTAKTTVATACYYCHNPVVLTGPLEGRFCPDLILPFSVPEEQAVENFMDWTKKKWFIPKAFFIKDQIKKIAGVYFPFWIIDCKIQGKMNAQGTKVRKWRKGDTEFTETEFYKVIREGDIQFHDITKNALRKANRKLVEGVQPFEYKNLKTFAAPYLSGFQAERRDMNQEDYREELDREIEGYVQSLLKDSINGYTTVSSSSLQTDINGEEWSHVLLPVWVLTYIGHNRKVYYYAMNGQTGKICGELPVDYGKLAFLFVGVALLLFALLMLGGGLL